MFLTGYTDTASTARAIRAGAEDRLINPVSSEQLVGAIERALARQEMARSQRSKLESHRALVSALMACECQVLNLIVHGKINKQIAYELGATGPTVKHRGELIPRDPEPA